MTTNDEHPGRKDPLFIDALRFCVTVKSASTSLIQRHFRIGYNRAAAIVDAMAQEGFIGDTMNGVRQVLISLEELEEQIEELQVQIDEAIQKEKKEYENFQVEFKRLLSSDEYKYVDQFAKKYGKNINVSELSKLQALLNIRGFEFSSKKMTEVVNFALSYQRCRDAKSKILNEKATEFRDIVRVYLNFYRPDDNEMLWVLKEIVEEKGLFVSNYEELKTEVEKINREIELDNFEKRLLEEDEQIQLDKIDNLSGYEFENFLKDLFSKMGYRVEQTRLSGDQGADLVVVKFGEKTIIQAKRYGAKVGNYAVQEIMAAISLYKAQKEMVITNSYFTPAAIELATANNIELINRDALERLINKHW